MDARPSSYAGILLEYASTPPSTKVLAHEVSIEKRLQPKLNRRLNRILRVESGSEHSWEPVGLERGVQPIWAEFSHSSQFEVALVATVEDLTIVAGRFRQYLRHRFMFYWCQQFPWDRLELIQRAQEKLRYEAENHESNYGLAFYDKLAAAWGGYRFSSLDELSAIRNQCPGPRNSALKRALS